MGCFPEYCNPARESCDTVREREKIAIPPMTPSFAVRIMKHSCGSGTLELSLPTRIRWDVDFRGRMGRPKRIARQIRGIAPQFVELRIEGERGIEELSGIFTEIHKCHPEIEATVSLIPKAAAAARWGYPIKFIWAIEAGKTFSRRIPADARGGSVPPRGRVAGPPDRMRSVGAIRSVPVDCDSCMLHSGCRGLAPFGSGMLDAGGF